MEFVNKKLNDISDNTVIKTINKIEDTITTLTAVSQQPNSRINLHKLESQPLDCQPQIMTCPQCQEQTQSTTLYREGLMTFFTCHAMMCTGLCWLPFILKSFKVSYMNG